MAPIERFSLATLFDVWESHFVIHPHLAQPDVTKLSVKEHPLGRWDMIRNHEAVQMVVFVLDNASC